MDRARLILDADCAQSLGYTGKGVGIAVLDTGLSPLEDFLLPENRISVFKDFIGDFTHCYDNNGHGTHVCGIVCGSGFLSGGRYHGIAPKANLIVLKILDKMGRGSTAAALRAIQWVMENKSKYNIRIVNMSVGTSDRSINSALVSAMYQAWDSGICIIAADGNMGSGNISIAAAGRSKKIITVGSYENTAYDCDITAPGVDIVSCMSPNYSFSFHGRSRKKAIGRNYIMMSGTSMATPMVSGAAALLIEKRPSLSPNNIKSLLINSSGENKLLNIRKLISSI
ncbi:serine protease AprX [Clostridiales bacterium]|nr:serine protease AprX [Clostridiales bacterium]